MSKTQYFLIRRSFNIQSLFQQVTTNIIHQILIAANFESFIHQTIIEFSLLVIHASLTRRGIYIVLEIVVGMKVDVKVIDDVAKEGFNFFDGGKV